jgi:small basic protein (TIGR04137 family)
MSRDRTLKTHGGLTKMRSVLKRDERIQRLLAEELVEEDKLCPFGLPKTKIRHSKAGTKSKKAEEKLAVLAEGEAAAPTAEGAAPSAPPGKGAPAAAGKAPAGKTAPATAAKAPAGKAAAGKAAPTGKPAAKEK